MTPRFASLVVLFALAAPALASAGERASHSWGKPGQELAVRIARGRVALRGNFFPNGRSSHSDAAVAELARVVERGGWASRGDAVLEAARLVELSERGGWAPNGR